jgi:hypothetical protein
LVEQLAQRPGSQPFEPQDLRCRWPRDFP